MIKTQEKDAKSLNNVIKVNQSNSHKLIACAHSSQLRRQKLKLQINVAITLLALNGETKKLQNSNICL